MVCARAGIAYAQAGMAYARAGMTCARAGMAYARAGMAYAQAGMAYARAGISYARAGMAYARMIMSYARAGAFRRNALLVEKGLMIFAFRRNALWVFCYLRGVPLERGCCEFFFCSTHEMFLRTRMKRIHDKEFKSRVIASEAKQPAHFTVCCAGCFVFPPRNDPHLYHKKGQTS